MTLPLAGQPGHGRTASLRRQPAHIVAGRMEGSYTSAFELICPSCGDHPYLDYSEVPPQLQRLRGPRTLQAGLAAYDEHLGLLPRPHKDRSASPDAGGAQKAQPGRRGQEQKTALPRAPAGGAATGLRANMNSADMDSHVLAGNGRTGHPASGPRNVRGPRPGTDTTTIPAAGEPGHGLGAILRRQPAGILRTGADGRHPGLFELICYDCGDDPGLAYGEIPSRLQWLRGPRPMAAAWAAYERHLGLGLTGRG